MPGSNEVDDKAMFFNELYALGQTSDNEVDTNETQQIRKNRVPQDASVTSGEALKSNPASVVSKIHCVRRTASQPISTLHHASLVLAGNVVPPLQLQTVNTSSSAPPTDKSSCKEATPSIKQNLYRKQTPRRNVSVPKPSAITSLREMENSSLGKRKRKDTPSRYVPEAQQIFLGCNFFFIPNNDVAPMRRARIRKAKEHGAVWCSEWSHDVTHIIVDKSLSYEDIISFLKIPSIPTAMIMTNDTYPIDCFQFKAILDPKQRQYRVKGHDQELEDKAAQKSSQTSDRSLQPDAAQSRPLKWDYVQPRRTPPRSEASTQNFPNARPSELQLNDASANTDTGNPDLQVTRNSRKDETEQVEQCSLIMKDAAPGNDQGDALDEIIREAHGMMHLPLDEDDSDRPPSRDEPLQKDYTNDERISGSPSKPGEPNPKHVNRAFDQENFSCMKGGNGATDISNQNSRTIQILQEMADYYARLNDTWRPVAYRKAISTLRQQTTKITTAAEAVGLQCIGQRLAFKIEEIVATDRLRRLENAKTEPGDHILQIFMGIYGVGYSQASKWLHSGYSTLEDLKANAQLTENQLLGIEHYDDFQTRIPRDEVATLGNIVKLTAIDIDPEVEIIIGGSYRRGAATSGDIDCIITKPRTSTSSDIFVFLTKLITKLTSSNFLVAALAVPRAESGTKWHGCCVLPGTANPIWRRIDFLLVPASELGAALIYFTGNDIFNRSIRLLASRKGMRLNQRGLYKNVMRDPGRMKLNEGELVEGAEEKKIFTELGVPWRSPEQRIC